MEELAKKLETYNIFNFLLPGIIFVNLLKYYVDIDIVHNDAIQMFFIYYFIGLILSRIGSLVIKPILEKTKFVIFASYNQYAEVTKIDDKIETLSTENNMYRTFISLFSFLLIIKFINLILKNVNILYKFIPTIVIILLIILFLFAYKKQTKFIKKRVELYRNIPS